MAIRGKAWWLALLLPAGCGPHRPPPPSVMFEGLPVSGSMADAQRAGFTDCAQTDAISLRCRRHKVMLAGAGPYEAALDLVGGDGSGGFDQLILWDDRDQDAVYRIADALRKRGWQHCNTATDDRGDQIIYTRKGERVRVSMDLSYWNRRRLRVLPAWSKERRC
jgi:hypothetical protein